MSMSPPTERLGFRVEGFGFRVDAQETKHLRAHARKSQPQIPKARPMLCLSVIGYERRELRNIRLVLSPKP